MEGSGSKPPDLGALCTHTHICMYIDALSISKVWTSELPNAGIAVTCTAGIPAVRPKTLVTAYTSHSA